MSLVAVCPKCGVENSAMNVTCDVCKAPLGSNLVEVNVTGLRRAHPILMSALIVFGLYMPCWLLKLGGITLLLAMFYGPLLASYLSPDNVVWKAAIGGLVGVLAIFVFVLVVEPEVTKAIVAAIVHERSVGAIATFMIGVPLLFVTMLPVSLVGASTGEHLSAWRRQRLLRSMTIAPGPAHKMTDQEIENTKL